MTGNTLSIGQFANFVAAVTKALPRNMSPRDALAWEKNGEKLAKALASALCPLAIPILSAQTLTLSGESIVDLITVGKYGWVNKDINNKNFPHNLLFDGEWEWDSWNPKDSISSEKAHAACSEDDWMPAMAQHLLVFGAKYPGAQRANPIVGLDSSYRDGFDVRHVPVLRSGDGGRELYLDNWISGWSSNARFLRVRRLVA